MIDMLVSFFNSSGFMALDFGSIVMIGIACLFLYLAIAKGYEPYLLIPISFGMLLANLPLAGLMDQGGLLNLLYEGVHLGIYPPLIFLGVGASTDFSPLIANPKSLLLGAAAQLGIFFAFTGAILLGFNPQEAGSIGIIGGADGPTALFVTAKSEDKAVLTTCSALHFAPPKKITWRIVFHETPFAPERFRLL